MKNAPLIPSSLRASKKTAKAAIEPLEDRRLLSVSLNAAGFTTVTPSPDSRLIYVSTSGSDSNNSGLSPSSPVASIGQACSMLRNGYPDWILLKRGDTFYDNFAYFNDSGRSKQEPAVVTNYGDASLARPVVDSGGNNAFVTSKSNQHVDILGIAFTASTHNPGSPNFNGQGQNGFYDLGGTTDMLIEDCSFSYFTFDLTFVGNYSVSSDITVRRSQILDAYSNSTATHSEGLYAENVNGLNIEDNVFDHDGWNSSVSGGAATVFNHDCYLHSSNNGVVVTGNIFADASSFGLQARSGGVVDNNVFINNPHAFSFGLVNGATTRAGGVSGEVIGNVVLGVRSDPSGSGFGAVIGNLKVGGNTVVSNNIFSGGGGALAAINLMPGQNVSNVQQEVGLNSVDISNNISYGWGFGLSLSSSFVPGSTGADGLSDVSIHNNDFQADTNLGRIIEHASVYNSKYENWAGNVYNTTTSSSIHWFVLHGVSTSLTSWQATVEPTAVGAVVPFVDPTRSVTTYMASLGKTASLAAFIAGARGLSSTDWNSIYLPATLANYIEAGFALPSSGKGTVSGSVTTADGTAMPNVTVYIDKDNSGTFNSGDPNDVTDSAGAFSIANVPVGSQILRQVLPAGDTQTTPSGGGGISVSVTSGGTVSNQNFIDAVATTGSVSGSVKSSTGAPIAGVTVYVDADGGGTFDTGELSAVTSSTGAYTIADVPAGSQLIRQVLPAGDTQTTPTNGDGIQVNVVAGGSLFSENFIDAVPVTTGSVSGSITTALGAAVAGVTVYVDVDGSATFNSGDLSAVTSSTGAYTIANVPAGDQVIRQVLPGGDAQVTPLLGGGIPVTVVAGSALANENFIDTVSLLAGTVSGSVTNSAGAGILGMTLYLDANNNSKLDSGELSAITAADGSYIFNNVPSTALVIRQHLPAGDTQITPSGGLGIHISVPVGGSLQNQNFVDNVPAAPTTGTVSGSVKSSGGTAIAGVTVYADTDHSGGFNTGDLFAVTTSTGAYTIAGVPAGSQTIRQVVPSGDTQTTPAAGQGIAVTVVAGGALANENFIDTVPTSTKGSVSGSVKTSAGKAIANVTIYLDTNNNGKKDTGELSAVTSSTGTYLISGVASGATVIRQIVPTGHTQTTPGSGLGIHITIPSGGSMSNENFIDI